MSARSVDDRDAWVDQAIHHIRDQIHQDHHERGKIDGRLHDRRVAHRSEFTATDAMPGMLKGTSTKNSPVTAAANEGPSAVNNGISALRKAWRQITARSRSPLARACYEEALALLARLGERLEAERIERARAELGA